MQNIYSTVGASFLLLVAPLPKIHPKDHLWSRFRATGKGEEYAPTL